MKFHNDGEESVTIYKAAKDKKVAEAKKWNGIFLETSEALEHIHNCGYAHNDLKSNNVVLEKREDLQLSKAKRRWKGQTKFKTKLAMNVTEFFIYWTFVLLYFNKNCKQPNFKCVLLMTWS